MEGVSLLSTSVTGMLMTHFRKTPSLNDQKGKTGPYTERVYGGVKGYVQSNRLCYHSAQSFWASSCSPLDDFEGAHDQD